MQPIGRSGEVSGEDVCCQQGDQVMLAGRIYEANREIK